MKIVCIADTHRNHGYLDMPDGDVLIHAGDFTDWGAFNDVKDFSWWLEEQPYRYKIVIAGNHDVKFETYPDMSLAALRDKCKDVIFLTNSSVKINGIKFFGCPYTPRFGGAFQLYHNKGEDEKYWKLIPKDTDVVITHGPPFGIMDSVERFAYHDYTEIDNCGSRGLLNRIIEVKPKLHVYGHIHQGYGIIKQRYGVTFVNAALLNFEEGRMNKPIMVEI